MPGLMLCYILVKMIMSHLFSGTTGIIILLLDKGVNVLNLPDVCGGGGMSLCLCVYVGAGGWQGGVGIMDYNLKL